MVNARHAWMQSSSCLFWSATSMNKWAEVCSKMLLALRFSVTSPCKEVALKSDHVLLKKVQNTGTEMRWESIAHPRSAANLQVPNRKSRHFTAACVSGQDRLADSWPVSIPSDCCWGHGQARRVFKVFPGSPARFASCIPSATGLLPIIDPGSFWRRFFYCLLFCLFRVVITIIFFYRSTLIFKISFNFLIFFVFVLMHCEAKERFSWPMRSGTCAVAGIVYGQLLYGRAKPHISNICRMHMKNFAVISQEKGIRSMKRINQLWSRDENNWIFTLYQNRVL